MQESGRSARVVVYLLPYLGAYIRARTIVVNGQMGKREQHDRYTTQGARTMVHLHGAGRVKEITTCTVLGLFSCLSSRDVIYFTEEDLLRLVDLCYIEVITK